MKKLIIPTNNPQYIPHGYCHCGCGQRTNQARQAIKRYGMKKGDHFLYISGHQMRGRKMENNTALFWANVAIADPDDCWEWQAGKISKGYGIFTFDGQQSLTHRISYELHFGKIIDDLFVCHKCDNPPCVNPNHLFLGTDHDNVQDCVKKGRTNHKRGDENARTKWTYETIYSIREHYKNGEKPLKLAKEHGISKDYIYRLIHKEHD